VHGPGGRAAAAGAGRGAGSSRQLGVRHRLAAILGLALYAVLAGARSFMAIAEWAADADQVTRDGLGITGVVPCESTFRRTLQALDADALNEAAGGWPGSARPGRRAPAARSPWTARHCADPASQTVLGGTCWPRSITSAAWS
jgi:DDE_Tnp_1-associated